MSTTKTIVMKSCSDGELLSNDKSVIHNSDNLNHSTPNVEHCTQSRLKRTFTLPRNPLRISKRKPKSRDHQNNETNNLQSDNMPDKGKKVFRRPSWKKFINKLAQHMNYNDRKHGLDSDNRVPPIINHQWGPEQTPGVTGLRNHGNTCFMNAVLQCLAHTDILAEYFVLDQYKVDMSRRNKLNARKFGTRGELTEQLALMLKALWACKYSPELSTAFKATVERYGAQYRGTQQHDAQEFLLWILDKVHEDLNTASKKKYKAIKTLNRPDEVIAAETLANHVRCNSSFVQAVFQAQFRSSLTCPRCHRQSNTFDPFHCISVQLPQLARRSICVTVLYTSQQPRQVRLAVTVPITGATIAELREQLSSDTSIELSQMILTEIQSGEIDGNAGFGRTFSNTQPVGIIAENDPIYCIEVPQLKEINDETTTSAYILLCWINVLITEDGKFQKFGSPYTMQVSRETSYNDLQKLILKEMASILHDDVLTSAQPSDVFVMRLCEPAFDENEALDPTLSHPLFTEIVDQTLALCSTTDSGPPHIKLILEWTQSDKQSIIADDKDQYEEHYSVTQLRAGGNDLNNSAPLTLADCLRHYTRAETLAAEDAWRCPHCQQYLPVVKTLGLWSLPDILVIHFKRFRQQQLKGRNSSKLTTMVDFPLYGFDMTPHLANKNSMNSSTKMSSNHLDNNSMILGGLGWSPWKRPRKQSHNNDNTYDLYAVCYHHGDDLETGHYTAACKNPYDNSWYCYDDTKVTNLSQTATDITSELVNNSAYILFYQKRSGVYVGSSSSSAASTSSVGSSGGDHWVARMPKFTYVAPKVDKKSTENEKTNDDTKNSDDVNVKTETELKNATNLNKNNEKLPSDEQENSDLILEPKIIENMDENQWSNENEETKVLSSPVIETKPIYTTSIYINSFGNVDITTSCTKPQTTVTETAIKLSINDDQRSAFFRGERGYATLGPTNKNTVNSNSEKMYHSDDEAPPARIETLMSPPPVRKIRESITSM
ncbi:ubiquitin carboxyl-terminal hydrolase 31 isoform X1 [Chrysoperla carnea]|uniref:ubiquitin carboxyl-terminal hydrolase 31 isoform X1 n=1 Tax=Chrysoperla carnea TaxID=189513 RepID=UPI001D0735FD|nr:ubiquitin carboxyl-terminal hydrolase 31 isoform X1 [Chrysoperla carnea]